ncbi:MAG: PqqD family protein [Lachnospiraceae bacterium]|nr:PqqD family protein [Lachnospiraceae bacterium]
MKIKEGYLLREVAGSKVVLPIGQATLDFNGMATLNETGAFLFEKMKEEITEEELVKALLNEYDIDEDTAKNDVNLFVEKIKGAGILE